MHSPFFLVPTNTLFLQLLRGALSLAFSRHNKPIIRYDKSLVHRSWLVTGKQLFRRDCTAPPPIANYVTFPITWLLLSSTPRETTTTASSSTRVVNFKWFMLRLPLLLNFYLPQSYCFLVNQTLQFPSSSSSSSLHSLLLNFLSSALLPATTTTKECNN